MTEYLFTNQPIATRGRMYKRAVDVQERVQGVQIVRISAMELKTYQREIQKYADEDGNIDPIDIADPIHHALYSVDETFKSCYDEGVVIRGALSLLIEEADKYKSKAHGCVFLALETKDYDTSGGRQMRVSPIGIMSVTTFRQDADSLLLPQNMRKKADGSSDYDVLSPLMNGHYLYIDAICSKRAGIGTLLVQKAQAYAITKKFFGLVALAVTPELFRNPNNPKAPRNQRERRYQVSVNNRPRAEPIFDKLGYTVIIDKADFEAEVYGIWFLKMVNDIDLSGLSVHAIDACVRVGRTPATRDKLYWRCPGN